MYSVVLLMALSGGADAPAFGSCSGCSGCDGWSCSGCCGGWSCSGCCGGNKLFGGMKLFGGKGCCGGCDGCCGGCCGGSCHGCCGGYSSCHGCCGGWSSCSGCCGGNKLFGGMKLFGGKGCCGGSCHGGCCGGGCCGGCTGCGGGVIIEKPAMPKAEASAPATIVVSLPAEAKLTIDGNNTTSTSERRVFVSPALEAGQEYFYTLKAEIKGEVRTERVAVTAGQEVNVKIEFPAAVAAK